MRQLAELVKDIGTVEASPKLEGKKLIMVLAPGAAKKSAMPVAKIVVNKPKVAE